MHFEHDCFYFLNIFTSVLVQVPQIQRQTMLLLRICNLKETDREKLQWKKNRYKMKHWRADQSFQRKHSLLCLSPDVWWRNVEKLLFIVFCLKWKWKHVLRVFPISLLHWTGLSQGIDPRMLLLYVTWILETLASAISSAIFSDVSHTYLRYTGRWPDLLTVGTFLDLQFWSSRETLD